LQVLGGFVSNVKLAGILEEEGVRTARARFSLSEITPFRRGTLFWVRGFLQVRDPIPDSDHWGLSEWVLKRYKNDILMGLQNAVLQKYGEMLDVEPEFRITSLEGKRVGAKKVRPGLIDLSFIVEDVGMMSNLTQLVG
jgi:hypothetical protein